MKRLLVFLPGFFFIVWPGAAYAQDVEIKVINDAAMWPVAATSQAHREDWWLINPSDTGAGAVRVRVIFFKPHCDVEGCGPTEWSQRVEVRAVEDASRKLSPPFYLARGKLAWEKARQAGAPHYFASEGDPSDFRASMNGRDYVLSRTLSADKFTAAISMRSGAIGQEVYSCKTSGPTYPVCGDDGFEEIVWAGDLDGDGKLDFLAQFTQKYSVRHYYLYSSARAGQGKFVALSAEYGYIAD